MASRYKYSKGALPSEQYAAVDFDSFYADILHLIPTQGTLIDVGGGAGRDALRMSERSGRQATVINIDPDPARWDDSQKLYPEKMVKVQTATEFQKAITLKHPVFIQDSIQSLESFYRIAPHVKGDFVLCNAVMMFIPDEEQEQALNGLFKITAHDGTVALRYRTENLKDGMIKINHDTLESRCKKAGFSVTRTPPTPDVLGRDHIWHQLLLKR